MSSKKFKINVMSITDKFGNTHNKFLFLRQKDGSKKKVENVISGDLFSDKVLNTYVSTGVLEDTAKKETTSKKDK